MPILVVLSNVAARPVKEIEWQPVARLDNLGKLGKLAQRRIFSPPEDTVQKCRCLLFCAVGMAEDGAERCEGVR